MLNSFPIALITGALLGYLAGIGVGGGSLLILWLTLVLNIPHETARSMNLMFFIAAAGAVSIFRWKQGTLQLKSILPAILAGAAGAAIFAWISNQIDVSILRKPFGILLIITGLRELFYRPKEFK